MKSELLRSPTDIFIRYLPILHIADAIRQKDEQLEILDVGGANGIAAELLEKDSVIIADLAAFEHENMVIADAARLPFVDDTFDIAISIDTLEHIHPTSREKVMEEVLRVCIRGALLVFPYNHTQIVKAERKILEFQDHLGIDARFLHEHEEYGLVKISQVEGYLARTGYAYERLPLSALTLWLLEHVLEGFLGYLPMGEELLNAAYQLTNRCLMESLSIGLPYRMGYFIGKSINPGQVMQQVTRTKKKRTVPAREINQFIKAIIGSRQGYSEMVAYCEQAKDEIRQQHEELEKHASYQRELLQVISELKQTIEQMRQEFQEKNDHIDRLQTYIKKLEGQYAQAIISTESLVEQINHLKHKIRQLNEESQLRNEYISKLEAEDKQKGEYIEKQGRDYRDLERRFADLEEEFRNLQQKYEYITNHRLYRLIERFM